MDEQRRALRAGVLRAFGAAGSVVDELLTFDDPVNALPEGAASCQLPLPPEPFVEVWQEYAAEADSGGAWNVLRRRLPQLWFPIQAGISQTEAYRAATRRGEILNLSDKDGILLRSPHRLRLWIRPCLAGAVPVLCTGDRDDFVLLVQALSGRNEPLPVPDSMGACLVSGFNNWDRIRRRRDRWLQGRPEKAWDDEFRRIIPQKDLYQDCFLILAEGPYSGVSAQEMGLSSEEWLRLSLAVRLAHECTHYLTLRLFAMMRDHPLDELIADYVGVAAACGRYRADWFLRFVGLEDFPIYREGGRLQNYRGQPPLSDAAFRVLQALIQEVAANLERFDARRFADPQSNPDRGVLAPALYQTTLEELAGADVETLLSKVG